MTDRPNILWFCSDQQRYDTIGGLNNPLVRTPNLDALMARGVAFEHAFAQSPICTPSRASFLTGRYPRTCRGRQNGQAFFPGDEVLVAQYLADHGYDGGLSGKLHLSVCCGVNEKDHRPADGYRNFWWSHHPKPDWPESDYGQWLTAQGVAWDDLYHIPDGQPLAYAGMPEPYHQTTWCVDCAIEHIDQDHGDAPWLMSVNPFDPHHPFDPPADYLARYNPDDLPLPACEPDEWLHKTPYQAVDRHGCFAGQGLSAEGRSEQELRQVVAAYYAMVELLDAQFGRLMNHLADSNQLDNTLVIYTSDHGELLGDHGLLCKGPHFYEPSIRVPLIMSWPGHWAQGVACDALVELLDLAPTLTEAVGLPPLPGFQGRSLGPLLRGETDHHRDDVYAEYHHGMPWNADRTGVAPPYVSMLRTERHKLVVYHGVDAGELYDLHHDPGEHRNLWDSPAHRDVRERLLRRCFDRVVFSLDPLPQRVGFY